MSNVFHSLIRKVQQPSVAILARKCTPGQLPAFLQDPHIATLVLRASRKDMPLIIIQWNDAGFNDVPAVPNCRNGIPGQTKEAIIANIVAGNATNFDNTVFRFSSCTAVGAWERPGNKLECLTSATQQLESPDIAKQGSKSKRFIMPLILRDKNHVKFVDD
ncbi:3562_t:CDS:2 [Ambispora gerdemannii]|uniref:3562_t:CDS:1 n=1 Tax=Ambispora gerdemannii TaxID=144530 RepID=A0A9N9GC94_9GLOM|nr:3562_t:CDS:2 [Ambispora gerdemannii]